MTLQVLLVKLELKLNTKIDLHNHPAQPPDPTPPTPPHQLHPTNHLKRFEDFYGLKYTKIWYVDLSKAMELIPLYPSPPQTPALTLFIREGGNQNIISLFKVYYPSRRLRIDM